MRTVKCHVVTINALMWRATGCVLNPTASPHTVHPNRPRLSVLVSKDVKLIDESFLGYNEWICYIIPFWYSFRLWPCPKMTPQWLGFWQISFCKQCFSGRTWVSWTGLYEGVWSLRRQQDVGSMPDVLSVDNRLLHAWDSPYKFLIIYSYHWWKDENRNMAGLPEVSRCAHYHQDSYRNSRILSTAIEPLLWPQKALCTVWHGVAQCGTVVFGLNDVWSHGAPV